MTGLQYDYYWVRYWHERREQMAAAFASIRVKRELKEVEPDRSHRYHTMLDNQLFKLLKEFRQMRDWRLSTLDLAPDTQGDGA